MEVTSYRSPTVWTDFRSSDNPWDLAPCEYHIPSEVDNMYHSLDFTVRSHVAPKFAGEDNYSVVNIANNKQKGEHFTKSKNAMFELKDMGDKSSRNLQKTPIFNQSRPTKTIPSEETVAYCDTAIVHQEFLYDVPKHSIIDGVGHSNKEGDTNNFTANQRAVTIFPSKEINQVINTRIAKDKRRKRNGIL
ncbi:unnamed protein product [Mytilus coruscus]|uniref:Uncharacterized protein n=1 Tax=Mytilus coruscus TaxID=42192 RepID=A0A6J8CTQ6_MYTCO|nr:unnamed protein product [Mytilus coruscus]